MGDIAVTERYQPGPRDFWTIDLDRVLGQYGLPSGGAPARGSRRHSHEVLERSSASSRSRRATAWL